MTAVTTYFDSNVDGSHHYYRPRLPGDLAMSMEDYYFSAIWYAADILAINQANQNDTFNYAVHELRPSVTGQYTFLVEAAEGLETEGSAGEILSDTQLWLYDTSFDPQNPLANIIVANEDIDYKDDQGVSANWLSWLPNIPLQAGHVYVLVVTTYTKDSTGTAHLSVTGPAALPGVVTPLPAPPAVVSVDGPAGAIYGAGAQLDFSVRFDEAVTVDTGGGTPLLDLVIGGRHVQAHYLGGSGTTALAFRYLVAQGDEDVDGVTVAGLLTNGGTIRDADANDADTTLHGVADSAGVLVETSAPEVLSIDVAQQTAAAITWTVRLSEEVAGMGVDDFTLAATGSAAGTVAAIATIDGKTWTVTVDGLSGDGTLRLDLNGAGTGIADLHGNAIAGGFAAGQAEAIARVAPSVVAMTVPAAGAVRAGDTLGFTITFDETVVVTGTDSKLGLVVGGVARSAIFAGHSGATVTYHYTVQAGDDDVDGITVGVLAPGASTIRDSAGNDASLALTGHLPPTGGIVVDTTAPAVAGVTVPVDGTHGVGAPLDFTVAFDGNVTVTGTNATLDLLVGGAVRSATFLSKGADTITYRYTVQPGDADADGITVLGIAPHGDTIRDAAGNDATLALAGRVPPTNGVLVDGTLPDNASPVFAGATVDGSKLVLTYADSGPLDATHGPAAGAFTVIAGGVVMDIAAFAIDGAARTVTLTLVTAVLHDQPVIVAYADPTGSNDAAAIQDAAGNDAATLAAPVVNTTPPVDPPPVDPPPVDPPPVDPPPVDPPPVDPPPVDPPPVDPPPVDPPPVDPPPVDPPPVDPPPVDPPPVDPPPVDPPPVDPPPVDPPPVDPPPVDPPPVDPPPVDPPPVDPPPVDPPPVDPPPVDPPPVDSDTIDGVVVRTVTVTHDDGSVSHVVTIPVVTATRVEQVGDRHLADIALVTNAAGASLLTAQLPVGFGLEASGATRPGPAAASLADLVREIRAHTADGSVDQAQLAGGGSGFVDSLGDADALLVQTLVPIAAANAAPGTLTITGAPAAAGHATTALVIDARGLPAGTGIALQDVAFAAVVGAVRIVSGAGAQVVWGDGAAQEIMLGAGDDELHGGAGNDIVGSAAGDDRLFGDDGDDILFGGRDDDTIDGGSGNDTVQLFGAGRADYSLRVSGGKLVVTHRDGGTDGTDVVAGVETLRFAQPDTSLAGTVGRLVEALAGTPASVATLDAMTALAAGGATLSQLAQALLDQAGATASLDDAAFIDRLYRNVLDRAADSDGMAWWSGLLAAGVSRGDVALGISESAEKLAMPASLAFGASDVAAVVRLYGTLFGRLPDEAGINYWIGAHEAGVSIMAIAGAFVASEESALRYGALDDAQFVDALYRTGLHRAAGTEEARYWTDMLADGRADRGDVLLGFADSPEKIGLVGTLSTSIATL